MCPTVACGHEQSVVSRGRTWFSCELGLGRTWFRPQLAIMCLVWLQPSLFFRMWKWDPKAQREVVMDPKKMQFTSFCCNCPSAWEQFFLPPAGTWACRLVGLRQRFIGLFIYCKVFPTASGLMQLWFLVTPRAWAHWAALSASVGSAAVCHLGWWKEHSESLQSAPLLRFQGVGLVKDPGPSFWNQK